MSLRNPFAHFISSIAALVVASATTLTTNHAVQQPPTAPDAPRAPEQPRPPQDDSILPAPPRCAIDPHALRLVQRVGEHIAASQSLTSRITYSFEVRGPIPEGELTQRLVHEMAFQQPNLMRLELSDGRNGETIVSDGESLYTYLPRLNRYTEQPAPSDMRGLMEHPGALGVPGGLGGPLTFVGMILVPEMFDTTAPLLRSATYLGVQELDGEEMHLVTLALAIPDQSPPERMEPAQPGTPAAPTAPLTDPVRRPLIQDASMRVQPDQQSPGQGPRPGPNPIPGALPPPTPGDRMRSPRAEREPELLLDLWIQDHEDNAVLRRMRIDLARLLEGHHAVPEELEDLSIDVIINMDAWAFNVEIPEETFAFEPPEGAERVDTLRDMVAVDGRDPERHPLVGQPAPSFELQRLVGTMLELGEHLGEHVIVLDFWASWCTPCVRAIPHMMSLADEFRGQNVVFYFVNLREDFERVQRFVEEQGWEGRIMIPMDIDGSVAQLYNVTAIPQSVIIGKDGNVQAVHIGFAPGMEERLRKEIQTLIDGGTLIEEQDDDDDDDDGIE